MSDTTTPISITAAMVSALRERTGAGMMECKKFLQMTNGDIEKAIEEMRKSGATKAAKKEGRITAEGIIAVASSGKLAVILEVNCETDFVARGDDFQQFAKHIAQRALDSKTGDITKLPAVAYQAGQEQTIEHARQDLIAKIGENITLRRLELLETADHLSTYLHGSRIGVVVEIAGANDDLGRDMAMQIAASKPTVVTPDQVDAAMIAKEREIYLAQAAESGKPQDIIEKMVNGRITKYLDEVSLVGQPFVKDPDAKVGAVLKKANATVKTFVRYEVGEGIEKKTDNFVEEVLAQARGN